MQILTERLSLTHFKAEYAEAFTEALQDPRIFTYLPESVPELSDMKELIQWFVKRDLKNFKSGFVGTNLALRLRTTKQIIGWCGLQAFEPMPAKFEIFFGLSPDYWNKGYMTEAARAVLNFGFEELHLAEIVAGVKPDNIASIRVLEKTGFVFQKIIADVPKGSEFYLGELFYTATKTHHQ